MYGIEHPVQAYCFDRAVTSFGIAYENDMDEYTHDAKSRADAKAKAKLCMDKWLREPNDTEVDRDPLDSSGGFSDPAERFAKKG